MGTPYLSEIRIFPYTLSDQSKPPKGWAWCDGQLLPINQNQALFSLLGTMYGGNGQNTFALPDLRGRLPMHVGAGYIQGQAGGQEFHTITAAETPAHNHFVAADNNAGTTNSPSNNYLANSNVSPYRTTPDTTLHPSEITNVGGNQPHENRMPFLVLAFAIALQGVFPSRN
jgi:microcystin-dependent protein